MPKRKNDCIDLYHFDAHPDYRGPQVIHQIKFVEHPDQAESADEGGELNVTCYSLSVLSGVF